MTDVLLAGLFVAAVGAIAAGAALIYTPAGLITGGVLTAGTLIAYERGRAGDTEPPQ